ncbi:hypothetical protein UACE39S_03210 [Ureibacillus acetophenoni]
MKRKHIFSISGVVLLALFSLLILSGGSHNVTHDLKVKSNEMIYDSLKNDKIMSKNNEKFGTDYKTGRLDLKIEETGLSKEYSKYEEVEVNLKGNIHTSTKTFPFDGNGIIQKINLKNQDVYWGFIDIDIKNRGGKEEGVLTIRYRPETDDVDISITSGEVPVTGLMSFGKIFLSEDEIFEILSIIGG